MSEMIKQHRHRQNDTDFLMALRLSTAASGSATTSPIDVDVDEAGAWGHAFIEEQQDLGILLGFHQQMQLFLLKNITALQGGVVWDEPIVDLYGTGGLVVWTKSSVELPDTVSPFDILSDSEQEKRRSLIEEIKEIPRSYAQKLYRRIQLLNESAEEEYPYEELLSPKSLEGFLKFMKRKEPFKYPDTTITPDGNIRIQWQQDQNHHLAIEFISDTEAKVVVFAPDPAHPMKVARASFRLSRDSVIDAIAPCDALKWAA